MSSRGRAICLALLAAALYAVNVPFSKLILEGSRSGPTMLAGFLYVGAGVGVGLLMLGRRLCGAEDTAPRLCRSDLPYAIAMVVLDVAAPIFLMYGVANTTSANVSLLNNLEIVATSLIAMAVFGERIGGRLWAAIGLVVCSGVILGFEGAGSFVLNRGSLFVLCACLCWGVENNCTRSISDKSAEQIVLVKGLGSGLGGVVVALSVGERFPGPAMIGAIMVLGFVAYGLSIKFYIGAQKHLGAAKTSAFYSVAPFLGVGFSFLMLGERPRLRFYLAFVLMAAATVFMVRDTLRGEPTKQV